MSFNDWLIIIVILLFWWILLPLWVFHAIIVNYFPCSWFGKFTEYAHCEEENKDD